MLTDGHGFRLYRGAAAPARLRAALGAGLRGRVCGPAGAGRPARLAAVLNLWGLSINGWANTYYAAAVRSMTTSWHDFLFASLDKTGLMTVDKPPLAFWVQALSVARLRLSPAQHPRARRR